MEKYYHMTKYEYLESIDKKGLMPKKSERSLCVDDNKTEIYFSKGLIPTIIQYFGFYNVYYDYKGSAGDQAIIKCNLLIDEYKKLKKSALASALREYYPQVMTLLKIVNNIRSYETFEDFVGEGVYLSVLDVPNVEYNDNEVNNCWTKEPIASEKINVLLLQDKCTKEIRDSKFDIINYLLGKFEIRDLLNGWCKNYDFEKYSSNYSEIYYFLKDYYAVHKEEFNYFKENFDLIEMPLHEYLEQKKKAQKNLERNLKC